MKNLLAAVAHTRKHAAMKTHLEVHSDLHARRILPDTQLGKERFFVSSKTFSLGKEDRTRTTCVLAGEAYLLISDLAIADDPEEEQSTI